MHDPRCATFNLTQNLNLLMLHYATRVIYVSRESIANVCTLHITQTKVTHNSNVISVLIRCGHPQRKVESGLTSADCCG